MVTLKVALVSSRSKFCDIESNLKHIASLTRRAANRGATLICFPELALTSYTTEPQVFTAAVKIPGPLIERLEETAGLYHVYLSVGLAEKARDKFYITQGLVGPGGYIGKYRKRHPTPDEQACGFSPGRSFPAFVIGGFRLGINICADRYHQDTIEAMREANVDVVHHPHGNGFRFGKNAHEWTSAKSASFASRAAHARAYILINTTAGDTEYPGGTSYFPSGAMIFDPSGQVVKRTGQNTRSEKMITATLKKPFIPNNG